MAAIDAIDGPVVVVCHSYGGVPSRQAAAVLDAVEGLIYVAAFQLDVGGTCAGSHGQTRVRRINSCHSPFLSQPENMAALIGQELSALAGRPEPLRRRPFV